MKKEAKQTISKMVIGNIYYALEAGLFGRNEVDKRVNADRYKSEKTKEFEEAIGGDKNEM